MKSLIKHYLFIIVDFCEIKNHLVSNSEVVSELLSTAFQFSK